jgi:LPXTG-site transpeptidase (sortase) family protein
VVAATPTTTTTTAPADHRGRARRPRRRRPRRRPAHDRPPAEGDPVARLQAPSIGLDWIVVSGVGVDDLKKGPGHYPDTPLPGQNGNIGIAGHRTTYGAPFFRIDELAVGDDIVLTALDGRQFTYKVTDQFIVSPSQTEVLAPSDTPILTLTSCHPRYSAKKRIIVQAALDPGRSAPLDVAPVSTTPPTVPPTDADPPPPCPATKAPPRRPPATTAGAPRAAPRPCPRRRRCAELQRGWFDDPDAWLPVALWGLALTGIALVAWRLSRRTGHNWIGALAGLLPFLVCLYFFFENVNRLLPPTSDVRTDAGGPGSRGDGRDTLRSRTRQGDETRGKGDAHSRWIRLPRAMLDVIATEGHPPVEEMTADEARAVFAPLSLLQGDAPDGVGVEQREIAGVPCEVVIPPGAGARPVLIWIHGGGWVVGTSGREHGDLPAAGRRRRVHRRQRRLPPRPRAPVSRGAGTTAPRSRAGSSATRRSSAVIPPASPSAATRRAATSARWWPTRCRGWSSSCWCTRPPTSRSPLRRSTRTVTATS